MTDRSHLDENGIDPRHAIIIDSLPHYKSKKEVLIVGAGNCRIDRVLLEMGHDVTSTDYLSEAEGYDFEEQRKEWGIENIAVHNCNIFDLSTFPKQTYESVICAEVLEHLIDYRAAFDNLMKLTERRLVITVPWGKSFDDPRPPPQGHANYWFQEATVVHQISFTDIKEFEKMAMPYYCATQVMRTKARDRELNQLCYLIIIDKNQKWNY